MSRASRAERSVAAPHGQQLYLTKVRFPSALPSTGDTFVERAQPRSGWTPSRQFHTLVRRETRH